MSNYTTLDTTLKNKQYSSEGCPDYQDEKEIFDMIKRSS
jgi:hypothetical protein